MWLVSIGANGYRRSAERTEMNVDGGVVAIVGPNEAGKASLLEWLRHLNASGEFELGELTRGAEPPDGAVLWARYLLDPGDLKAIGQLHGAKEARWFVAWKHADGDLLGRVEPRTLRRDVRPRRSAAAALGRAAAHRTVEAEERALIERAQLVPDPAMGPGLSGG
jgi:hypothetical protein